MVRGDSKAERGGGLVRGKSFFQKTLEARRGAFLAGLRGDGVGGWLRGFGVNGVAARLWGCEIWRIFWGAMRVVRSGGGGEGVAVGGGWHGGMVRAVRRDPAAGMWGGRGGIGEPGVEAAAGSPPRIASPGSSPGQAGAGSPRGWRGRGRPGPEDPSPHSGGDAGSTRRARDRCCLSPRRGEECRNDGGGGEDGGGRRGGGRGGARGAEGEGRWAFGRGCGGLLG